MDRVENEERLSAYFDGELSSNEWSEMEARLRESPELRRTLADFQAQRLSFAALAAPALAIDLSDRVMQRVMEQVLATTSAPVTPPPFPLEAFPKSTLPAGVKRRFSRVHIAGVLSIAAAVALAAFFTRALWNPVAGETVPIVQADDPPSIEKDPSAIPPTNLPDSRLAPKADSQIASSDPQPDHPDPKAFEIPGAANVASRNEKPSLPLTDGPGNKALANSESPRPDPNSRLTDSVPGISVPGITAPKNTVYAAATSKSRPKAYRVQVGTRSEFDARLKEAGVSIYHRKAVEAASSIPRAQPIELLPDPEYILVEGSESQLADLVEKLGAQADLMLQEPKGDLEADMLIEALCKMDAAAETLRPAEAKEGEIAAFSIPPKAIYSLLPANLPTGSKPETLTDAQNSKAAPNPAPAVPPKDKSGDGSSLYVPRLLFILDVRMGETEGASSKR